MHNHRTHIVGTKLVSVVCINKLCVSVCLFVWIAFESRNIVFTTITLTIIYTQLFISHINLFMIPQQISLTNYTIFFFKCMRKFCSFFSTHSHLSTTTLFPLPSFLYFCLFVLVLYTPWPRLRLSFLPQQTY